MAARTIRKIKHEASGQDANKARGEAECFIGHRDSAPSALFYVHHFYFLFIIHFHTLPCYIGNIALQTRSQCYMANIAQFYLLIFPSKIL